MADNRKYYYLKLKDNFFESDELVVLESMPDGYLYSNILLKLYLKGLKCDGKLMFNDRIPYNSNILAQITRHSVGVVEKALQVFKELGLIEILDNGAIFLLDIQNYIGQSSTEGDRKRAYREKIEIEKKKAVGQIEDKCPDKCTPDIDIDLDIDLDKNIYGEFSKVKLSQNEYQKLIENIGEIKTIEYIDRLDGYLKSNNKKKYSSHYATIQNWYRKDHPGFNFTKNNNNKYDEAFKRAQEEVGYQL